MEDQTRRKPLFLMGVKFGHIPATLLAGAVHLARTANATLRVVHFCEPWNSASWISAYPEAGVSLESARFAELKYLEETQAHMEHLVASMPGDIDLESHVVFGNPVEGLHEEALRTKASLIICSANHNDGRFLLSGFSTAIGLMASSSIPVLVIPEDMQWDENKKNIKFLLCDDLTEQGEHLIAATTALGKLFPSAEYIHLHVCSIVAEEREFNTEFLAEAVSAGIVRHDPRFSDYQAMKSNQQRTEKLLEERFQRHQNLTVWDPMRYHRVSASGNVAQAIQQQQKEWDADIVALGRHELLHQKPFHFGRMPYRFMVNLERPVLLVPKETRNV